MHYHKAAKKYEIIPVVMASKTDYRAELLESLIGDESYILETIHTLVTDQLYDNLDTNQYFYTGLTEEELTDNIKIYGIEDKPTK